MRFQHAITGGAQYLDGEGADVIIVLDDQDRFFVATDLDRAGLVILLRHAVDQQPRQVELDGGAMLLLRIDLHMAAGLLDEAIDLAEPETGAAADVLGREERLEHARQHILGHAAAGVGDGDHHIGAGRHFGLGGGVALVEPGVGGFDGQVAAGRHRVAGVDGEVEDGRFELVGIGLDPPQAGRGNDLHPDRLAQRAAEQVRHAEHQFVDVERLGFERLAAREGQQPLSQRCRPLGALLGMIERTLGADVAAGGFQRAPAHVDIADHHRQQIVEIMGDTAGELADRLHLLCLAQRALGQFALGDGLGDALLQRLVEFAQRILGAFLRRDVLNGADEADGAAVLEHAAPGGGDPADDAVLMADRAIFDIIGARSSRRQRRLDRGEGRRPVVGVEPGDERVHGR